MITLMSCRYDTLKAVLLGFEKTGLQLIDSDGVQFFPSGISDDIGLYYFVPKLVRCFGISLDQAIYIFFHGMVFTSLVLALIGFFLLSKSWIFRAISSAGLFIFWVLACRGLTDVYLVQTAIVMAVIPLALYFLKKNRVTIPFFLFIFFSGISIGVSHYIRLHSSVGVLLFLCLGILFFLSAQWKKKVTLLAVLLAGILIPFLHFNSVLKERRQFFGDTYETFEPRHVFWHSIYAGLGFLDNKFGIKWDDSVIVKKVEESHPNAVYPTKAYEEVTKQEVLKFVQNNFSFVRLTLFAKLGVIFYYLLIFANIGLLLSFFYKKPWILEFMFWSAIAFNSLFGLLVMPFKGYLLGMIAFATVYGLVSIWYALEGGLLQDIGGILKIKKR